MRVPNLHYRALRPPHAPIEKNSSWKEYFALSKCMQNFDFLALVVSEIWGGPKFTLGALRPRTPPSEKIFIPKEYLARLNVCRIFHFLAVAVSEIWGGPKFTLG